MSALRNVVPVLIELFTKLFFSLPEFQYDLCQKLCQNDGQNTVSRFFIWARYSDG